MKSIKGMLISVALLSMLLNGCALLFNTSWADDLAIKGYDTVAYFTASKPVKGSNAFFSQWHNLTWYFSTKENRDLFAANPEKYAPQYDGYCAWALTEARLAITDPEIWKIVDGKLYLNCSQAAYERWSRDIPGNIKKAEENWRKMNEK